MVPFVDLTRQHRAIRGEIDTATGRVYEKGRFILGEEVSAFEKEFAGYCGVRHGVGVGSGTDALYLALKALGIGEGHEVVTVANSFIASALAVSFTGARPVFVDIDPKTYTMDPERLKLFLKRQKGQAKRIKAILPVHLYGRLADMDGIMEVARRHDIPVIEDACQAHGAGEGKKKAGSFGLMACFSFYPTKNLGAYGDGGMIVTDSRRLDERLRLLRCYGEKKKYEHVLLGGNSRLDELQAAILRVKLTHLDAWNEERREKARRYASLLAPAGVVCPAEKEGTRHVYHLYVIRARKRDLLQAFLKKRGIDTLIHYPIPIHVQKAYRSLGYRRGALPLTEGCSRTVLSLPLFPGMTESEVDEVARTVRTFIERLP